MIAGLLVVFSPALVLVAHAEKGLSAADKAKHGWEEKNTVGKLELINLTLSSTNGVVATNMVTQLKMDQLEASSFENSVTKIKIGYVSFAPYTIKQDAANLDRFTLEDGSSSGSVFVEVAFADRYAWRTGTNNTSRFNWFGFGKNARPWDWEAKLGFILSDSSKEGETSGTTIAAGGDIYGEVALGYPLYYNQQVNKLNLSVGPEVVATLVTDKSSYDIHGNYKAVFAFVIGGADMANKRPWRLLSRVGVGWVDIPKLNADGTVNAVNQRPQFGAEFGTYTQVQFDLPIYETSTLSLSGEFWNGFDINPWSTYISYSTSFTGLKNFLPFTKK